MNPSRLLSPLLLAVPALAQAAPHLLVVRATNGDKVYEHRLGAEADAQTSFAGKVEGRTMIVNGVFSAEGRLQYQIEVSAPGGGPSFQVQSSVTLRPRETLRAVDCGDWKLDLTFDTLKSAAPSEVPSGGDLRLTAFVGKRTCKVITSASSQSNIVDTKKSSNRKAGFILNAVVGEIARGASKVSYQLQNDAYQAQGEDAVPAGKKTPVQRGKMSLLVESGGA